VKPRGDDIVLVQNEDDNVRLQATARHLYGRSALFRAFGIAIGVALAVLAPLSAALALDTASITLGAFGGLWVLASRLVLVPLSDSTQRLAADMQQAFDARVLGVGRSDRRPIEWEVVNHSTAGKDLSVFRDWYPSTLPQAWPDSVAACLAANSTWSSRLHGLAAVVSTGSLVVLVASDVIVGIGLVMSLTQFLAIIFLPTLSAFLDIAELAFGHFKASQRRRALGRECRRAVHDPVPAESLGRIQAELYELRREGPLTPGWIYRIARRRYDSDMQFAASRFSGS
jgi:hypothetical protein